MANPSLSEAIGLQAKPDLSLAKTALAREDARQAARARAEAAQRQKDEEEYQKMVKGADVYVDKSKYHNVYIPAVKENYRRTLEAAQKAHMENPHDLSRVEEILRNGAYNLNYYKTNSEKLFEQQKDLADRKIYANPQYVNQLESGDYSDVFFNDKTGRVESKGWAELSKTASSDPRFNHYFDPSGNVVYNPVKTFDFDAMKRQVQGSEGSYEPTGKVELVQTIGGRNVFLTKEKIRPQLADTYASAIIIDPDQLSATRIRYKDDFDKDYEDKRRGINTPTNAFLKVDQNGMVDPISEKAYLHEKLVNDLFSGERAGREMRAVPSEGGTKEKQPQQYVQSGKINLPISAAEIEPSTGKVLTEYTDGAGNRYKQIDKKYYLVKPSGEISKEESAVDESTLTQAPSVARGSWSARDSKTFNAISIRVSPEFVVDMNTTKQKAGVANVDYKIDGVYLLPYVITKDGKINAIRSNIASTAGKALKYGWFAVGTETGGMQQGEQVITPTAVPLTKQVYSSLINNPKNPVNLDIPENELWGSRTQLENQTISSSKTEQKESAQNIKEYTRAELKALSPKYTDAVIDSSVKAGIIKLK